MEKIYPITRKPNRIDESIKIFKFKDYGGFMCRDCYNYAIAKLDVNLKLMYKIVSGDFDTHAIGISPDFTYHCPNCGTCTQYRHTPIDPNIVPIISLLNKKGFETLYCCEGHDDEDGYSYPYVSFKHISHKQVLDYVPLFGKWSLADYSNIRGESELRWGIHISEKTYDTKKNMEDLYTWASLLPYLNLDDRIFTPDMITDEMKRDIEETIEEYKTSIDNDEVEENHKDFLDLKPRNY